ncbi:MAG: rod shape-determining protein RodA [Acidobacteria bacterium]|nr:rod shape-determining protein RodA [Acidobacteriota bacterium]
MIVDRRILPHLDWACIGAILALMGIGLAVIFSAKWDFVHQAPGREFWKQLYAIGIGLVVFAVCLTVDYRSLTQRSLFLYAGLILLLLYVTFFGAVRNNSRRWIPLGSFDFQPSEFARVVVALVLATYFAGVQRLSKSFREIAIGAAFLAVPLLLILKQPDLGTAVTLVPVFLGMAFLGGMRLKWLGIAALVALVLAWPAYRFVLTDYQRNRIQTFVNPDLDPQHKGYQQRQATITVGSGGLFGKGFGNATQAGGYGFLPEAHNDFVFASFAEEHGFVGVLLALLLYLFVILRSLEAAKLAKDRLGAYLVIGILSGFVFQVVYNITMSAGLAPVKGLTLPLMSYGGSSLMATLAGFGLILNVRMRRFTN